MYMISVLLQCVGIALSTATLAGLRIAPVSGNGNQRFAPLQNPVNDGPDISKTLEALGFGVSSLMSAARCGRRCRSPGRSGSMPMSGCSIMPGMACRSTAEIICCCASISVRLVRSRMKAPRQMRRRRKSQRRPVSCNYRFAGDVFH